MSNEYVKVPLCALKKEWLNKSQIIYEKNKPYALIDKNDLEKALGSPIKCIAPGLGEYIKSVGSYIAVSPILNKLTKLQDIYSNEAMFVSWVYGVYPSIKALYHTLKKEYSKAKEDLEEIKLLPYVLPAYLSWVALKQHINPNIDLDGPNQYLFNVLNTFANLMALSIYIPTVVKMEMAIKDKIKNISPLKVIKNIYAKPQ